MKHVLLKTIALPLTLALAAPSIAFAKPNPETIHRKIVQRGLDNWITIQKIDGSVQSGRIAKIEEQQFGLQISGYPDVTMVPYADVARLRNNGVSHKPLIIVLAATTGTFVASALIMHHEFEKNKPTMPPSPTTPTWP